MPEPPPVMTASFPLNESTIGTLALRRAAWQALRLPH
jgi:hypothetical protein